MKILMICIDMLRSNLLHLTNPQVDKSELDDWLSQLGGTLYPNCFTPAPDSGRSLGCLWSGQYPDKNGCDKRIKYPQFFLKQPDKNLLRWLSDNEYCLNLFINPNERQLGMLPADLGDKVYHNTDFDLVNFLKNVNIQNDSLTFISLTDLHWANDDYGYNQIGLRVGYQKLVSALKIIQTHLRLHEFDHVVILSDHGYKISAQKNHQPNYRLLDRDRSNIFLLWKTKNDQDIKTDARLCSIMDIYPTFAELLDVPLPHQLVIDGLSLRSSMKLDHIIAEDHLVFAPMVHQAIELWAIIRQDGIYYRMIPGCWTDQTDIFPESPNELDQLIKAKSLSFAEQQTEWDILQRYKQIMEYRDHYADGTLRRISPYIQLCHKLRKWKNSYLKH